MAMRSGGEGDVTGGRGEEREGEGEAGVVWWGGAGAAGTLSVLLKLPTTSYVWP